MLTSLVADYCRLVILITFALSSSGKLVDFSSFVETVASFRILPRRISGGTARLFLSCEVFAVLLLVTGQQSLIRVGLVLALFLLLLFTASILTVIRRNAHVSCNCFGPSDRTVNRFSVGRNIFFALCALTGFITTLNDYSTAQHSPLLWMSIGFGALASVGLATEIEAVAGLVHMLRQNPERRG